VDYPPCPPPTFATPRTPSRATYGPAVAKLADALGWPLMPWQRMAADVLNEVDSDGLFVYSTAVITVPRQSGKTTLTGANAQHRAIYRPRRRIWYTAQTREIARDWLLNEHVPGLEISPLKPYARVRRAQGSEGITYPHGSMFRIFAPLPAALHSKQSDLVIVDECWAHELERGKQIDQAIVPTQATRPGAQVWKLSTAGDEKSLWLWEIIQRGRTAVTEGRREGIAYFEWACPEDLDPCAPSSWARFHPAFGITIGVSQMKAALDELGPAGFARAYGNRWPEGMGATAAPKIPPGRWAAVQTPPLTAVPDGVRVALGFDTSRDRAQGVISVAWRDLGGTRCEIIDARPGTGWMAERLAEIATRRQPVAIGYPADSPALDIADELATDGFPMLPIRGNDWPAACAGWFGAISEGTIRIGSHPALSAAAEAAPGHDVGDGKWAWYRRGTVVSIAPVIATTAAVWALAHPVTNEAASWTAF
jgi:Phage terminase large subunit (GpA)